MKLSIVLLVLVAISFICELHAADPAITLTYFNDDSCTEKNRTVPISTQECIEDGPYHYFYSFDPDGQLEKKEWLTDTCTGTPIGVLYYDNGDCSSIQLHYVTFTWNSASVPQPLIFFIVIAVSSLLSVSL